MTSQSRDLPYSDSGRRRGVGLDYFKTCIPERSYTNGNT